MSKYASLPDIDDSGADVFETPDLPPQHTYSRDSDSEDEYLNRTDSSPATTRRLQQTKQAGLAGENINQERLDTKDARERFTRVEEERNKSKRVETKTVRRRLPSTEEYTLADERDKESPLERLRRLRSEVAELEDEVRRTPTPPPPAADSTTAIGEEVESSKGKGKKREVSPAVILQQLQLLRGDLKGIEPKLEAGENGVLEGEGERKGTDSETGQFEGQAKASVALLERLRSGRIEEGDVEVIGRGVKREEGSSATKGNQGELENRLAELEKLIGANQADLDESASHPVPMLRTLSRLDHLLTLLTQPRHLDTISRRVKVLVSDLERIHESRRKLGDTRPLNIALQGGMTLSTGGSSSTASPALGSSVMMSGTSSGGGNVPPDALQKIDSLFSLLPRMDPLLPLAPRLLTRLRSLQALHQSSTTFSTDLGALQTELSRLGENEKGLDEVLKGLEESMKGNQERLEGNLSGLEQRLIELGKRLDALNSS